jgi:pimeloyl-ACP methyl ester carboxylesterase
MTEMNANGITIEYETHGEADNPALILIRGLGTQLIHWPQAMLARLVLAGFFVVIFDNRDVGLSTKFDAAGAPDLADLMARGGRGEDIDVPYTLDDMAGDVIGLMDGLNIDRAHIAGISMGGMMAQVLAAKHGGRLRSMAAIMTHSGNPDLPQGDPDVRAALMNTPDDPDDREATVEAIVASGKALSGSGYPTPDKDRRAMAERTYDRCYCPEGRIRQRAAVVKSGNRVEMLRTITVPSQVIHGTNDLLLHISGAEDIAANIPNAEYHAIVGMGHETPASLSTNLSDLIANFANRADGR